MKVLNREKHRNYDEWHVGTGAGVRIAVGKDLPGGFEDQLSAFEAIAIAKEYERLRLERERAEAWAGATAGVWRQGEMQVTFPLHPGFSTGGMTVIECLPRHDPACD